MSTQSKSTEEPSKFRQAFPTVAASVISGVATRIPMHPVDTIKSQVQAFSTPTPLIPLLRAQKLRNLYSGFGITCLTSIPGVTLYFGSYEWFKKHAYAYYGIPENETSHAINFCAGLFAEAISCVVWVPGDIMKERLQIQQLPNTNVNGKFKTPFAILRDVYQKEGLSGVYKGYNATIVSFGPYSAFYLMFYEMFKKKGCEVMGVDPATPTLPLSFCAGGFAGAIASLITAPLDLIKIRLQMQRAAQRSALENALNPTPTPTIPPTSTPPTPESTRYVINYHYENVRDGLKSVYREGGVRGMFRGAGARIAFSAPSAALTISIWDTIRGKIDTAMNPGPRMD